jgi:autotransporter-associated beta strand protein
LGSTLNSQQNTIIANSSGNTIVFENDVAPSGDNLTESASLTYALGNSANIIQAAAGSNIIIDDKLSGSGDSLTFLGGGTGSTAGATLELGAGSANDVTGGVAGNAPTPANGGTFSGSSTVTTLSSDSNTFSGGLTIGDTNGTANAGIVKVDGGNALPTSGAITVNTNSQLYLNGSATYGGTSSTQTVTLNGTGTGGVNNGALTTGTSNTSTLTTTVSLGSTASIDVQGTSTLTLSGPVTGGNELESVGSGVLKLTGSNNYSGSTSVTAGTLTAGNANALGTGAVAVGGGKLSVSVATVNLSGNLSMTSGSIGLGTDAFDLSSGKTFSASGGTLDIADSSGTFGSIQSAGGASTFSLGGTLDLGGNTWNYANTYNILTGFQSGTVSGLTIIDYDSTDYTASVSNTGILSFAAVPEPKSVLLAIVAALVFFAFQRRRRSKGCA